MNFIKLNSELDSVKTAAFCAVANNLTTAASGYVLDARQGKELLTKMTSGLTRMTETTPGKIVLPNGAIIVYGFVPFINFKNDASIGGYSYTIPLSSYGLYSVTNCLITPSYQGGIPKVALNESDSSRIKIGVDVKLTTGGVYWMVIG